MPLLLSLHGAGIGASGPINFLGPYAESHGFFLLACDSRDVTWDAITGRYGPDVTFIGRALRQTFDRCAVNPARVAIEGFSDGASYALGLGLANGDLFSRVVAFSPGFIPRSDTAAHGQPEIFVSHGRQDPVLPIDQASRQIVPALRADGYSVTYVEYDGVHAVTAAVAEQAVDWLLNPASNASVRGRI
jgi:predicted esterase